MRAGAFLRRVEQILTEYDDALREAEDNSNVETGSVKLIAPTLELLTGFWRSYLPRTGYADFSPAGGLKGHHA